MQIGSFLLGITEEFKTKRNGLERDLFRYGTTYIITPGGGGGALPESGFREVGKPPKRRERTTGRTARVSKGALTVMGQGQEEERGGEVGRFGGTRSSSSCCRWRWDRSYRRKAWGRASDQRE